MISNRVKRNIWLTLTIMGGAIMTSRAIDASTGGKWWKLLPAICIFLVALKCFLSYRKAVKQGNLFGHIDPLGRDRQ